MFQTFAVSVVVRWGIFLCSLTILRLVIALVIFGLPERGLSLTVPVWRYLTQIAFTVLVFGMKSDSNVFEWSSKFNLSNNFASFKKNPLCKVLVVQFFLFPLSFERIAEKIVLQRLLALSVYDDSWFN